MERGISYTRLSSYIRSILFNVLFQLPRYRASYNDSNCFNNSTDIFINSLSYDLFCGYVC